MDTFMQIKELASKLTRDCFTKEQVLIITGADLDNGNMFCSTEGNFFYVVNLLTEYIEKLENNNSLGMTKYDILDIIRKTYEEDEI